MHAYVVDDGSLAERPRTYLRYVYFIFVFSYEGSVAFLSPFFVALRLKELYLRKAISSPLFAYKQPPHGLLQSIFSYFVEVVISSDSSDTENSE